MHSIAHVRSLVSWLKHVKILLCYVIVCKGSVLTDYVQEALNAARAQSQSEALQHQQQENALRKQLQQQLSMLTEARLQLEATQQSCNEAQQREHTTAQVGKLHRFQLDFAAQHADTSFALTSVVVPTWHCHCLCRGWFHQSCMSHLPSE